MALLTPEDLKRLRTRKLNIVDDAVAPANSRGLGDTVAKVIHKVSGGKIKPCGGCRKRQRRLNKLVPYGKKGKMDKIEKG